MLPSVHLSFAAEPISTYKLILALYLIAAFFLTVELNARQGVEAGVTVQAFLIGVPAGILGARVLDAFEYPGNYRSLGDFFAGGGSSIYGGLIGGVGVAVLYLKWRGIPPLRVLDAGAPAMALGEAITRIGCFLNGCCYGVVSKGPLALRFPPESFAFQDQVARGVLAETATHSLPVHPVQLYSSVVMLAVFVFLLRALDRRRADGQVFCAFLVCYGLWRLLIAPLRMEVLASMVLFSIGFIVIGVAGLLVLRCRPSCA